MPKGKDENKEINSLRPVGADFGAAVVKYTTYAVRVPGTTTQEDLVNHEFWRHFASKIPAGSEIRVVADDQTFWAHLYVVLQQGTELHVKLLNYVELLSKTEKANWSDDMFPGYVLVNGGAVGYFARVKSTGEKVSLPKAGYKKPSELVAAMEDYLKALAA